MHFSPAAMPKTVPRHHGFRYTLAPLHRRDMEACGSPLFTSTPKKIENFAW